MDTKRDDQFQQRRDGHRSARRADAQTERLSQSGPAVAVSGSSTTGAVINVLANGVLAANFTNNSSGNYAGSLLLPDGTNSLSATETVNGLTSGPSATVFVVVVTEPVPVILRRRSPDWPPTMHR